MLNSAVAGSGITRDLDNVKDLITLAFKTLNGRNIKAIQPAEIQTLLGTEHAISQIYNIVQAEINSLQENGDEYSTVDSRRIQKSDVENIYHPISDLYDILIDLILIRFKKRKIKNEHLIIRLDCNVTDAANNNVQQPQHLPSTFIERNILKPLGLNKIPNDENIEMLRSKTVLALSPTGHLRKPLIMGIKTVQDAERLQKVCANVDLEYQERARVLVTRLGVTAQAFFQTKNANQDSMAEIYRRALARINAVDATPFVSAFSILAATEDLLSAVNAYKVCSIPSLIKKINIGHVADRGGVPEGFTQHAVCQDVRNANHALQSKRPSYNTHRTTTSRTMAGPYTDITSGTQPAVRQTNGESGQPAPNVRRRVWRQTNSSSTIGTANTQDNTYESPHGSYWDRNRQPFPGPSLCQGNGSSQQQQQPRRQQHLSSEVSSPSLRESKMSSVSRNEHQPV